MNELAFIAVCTPTGRRLVPLLAIFRLIIFVLIVRPERQLMVTVRKAALVIKLANTGLHELLAQLRFIVYAEVLDIFEHGLSGRKIHDLLLAAPLPRQTQSLLHLQLSEQFFRVSRKARVLIRNLIQLCGTIALGQRTA